jgi:hypothetical protein
LEFKEWRKMEIIQIHHLYTQKGTLVECPYCKKEIRVTIDSEGDTLFLEKIRKND